MKKIISVITGIALTMSCIIFASAKNESGAEYIDIGDTASEAGYVTFTGASEPQTNTVDGTAHTYRTLGAPIEDSADDGYEGGSMLLTLKCDGDKTNYLTVKLWGDDTGDGMLWLTDVNGNMSVSGAGAPARNNVVDRRDWVELNSLKESPQYNGGFIYSTYMIPSVYTEGKDTVQLMISSTGGSADYSAEDKVLSQSAPSRGIYAVYITQDAYFDPSVFETVTGGLADTAAALEKTYDEQKIMLENYTKNAVGTFKSWQIYGQDNYPSYMEGMMTRAVDWKTKNINDGNWKDAYYSRMIRQNLTPMNMYEVFALAYENADKLEYTGEEKAELLDRIVKGIDFLVRAQGSNGGFYSSSGWIGGPDRKEASGNNLTGFGLRSAAYAALRLYSDIERGRYLTQDIDSDADGEEDEVRINAWENMMIKARDYLTSLDGAGHAPNQDMADIIAALRFNEVLKKIGSSYAWNDDEIINQLDMALGFKPNLACSSYWVSPKGLILENFGSIQGGYSGDYGINALEEISQLAEFASERFGAISTAAAKYIQLAELAYDVAENFMFTANASVNGDPTLYSEGLTSNRNSYYPGTERYVLDTYASLVLGSKISLKSYYYLLEHNKLETESSNYMPASVHYEDNILALMRMYFNFDEILAAFDEYDIEAYNYVIEDENTDEYAWADEMGRNVVIKNGDDKIYIALNWRNPLRSVEYYNTTDYRDRQAGLMNNLARVHHKTGLFDRYGYAELTTVGWDVKSASYNIYKRFENHYAEAFMYMNYGDYAVIMNSNNLMGNENDITYPIPYEELGLVGVYKDLISGAKYYFGKAADGARDGKTAEVPSASTMVLYKQEKPDSQEPDKIEYANGEITVRVTDEDTAGTDKHIFVYAAEYDGVGNTLVNLERASETVGENSEIIIPYIKKSEDNILKVFVWDSGMNPIFDKTEFHT